MIKSPPSVRPPVNVVKRPRSHGHVVVGINYCMSPNLALDVHIHVYDEASRRSFTFLLSERSLKCAYSRKCVSQQITKIKKEELKELRTLL